LTDLGASTLLLFSLNFFPNTHLEVMAPVIFASQQQFGFSHIASGSTAFGKVKNDQS
jgi:hypothetical protein